MVALDLGFERFSEQKIWFLIFDNEIIWLTTFVDYS